MEPRYDVIISGAGPSGSLLGYLLSAKGINTLIIEKQKFPRKKICAGGLQHRILALIPFDISGVIQKSIHGILFTYKGGDGFLWKHDHPIIHTTDRKEFDSFMVKKAQDSGCAVKFGERVTGYENEKEGVRVDTDRGAYRAKVIAGADGMRGAVHRTLTSGSNIFKILGYEAERKPDTAEKEKYDDAVGLDFGGTKKGYAWAFPKKMVISYGIGGPFSAASQMKRYFSTFLNNEGNAIPGLLAQCIPVRSEDTPVCGHRVVALGDAAGLGDGFTGEGIYNAVKSSHIAAESIERALKGSGYDFIDYRENIDRDIYNDIRMSLGFSRVFFSYPLFFYKLLRANERFFDICCQVMRGKREYSDITKKLKSFLR